MGKILILIFTISFLNATEHEFESKDSEFEEIAVYKGKESNELVQKIKNSVYGYVDDKRSLFDDLDLSLSFDFNKYFELDGKFTSFVIDKLSIPKDGFLTTNDHAKVQVASGFLGRLTIDNSFSKYLDLGLQVGHYLAVARTSYPEDRDFPKANETAIEHCKRIKTKYANIVNEKHYEEIISLNCNDQYNENLRIIYSKMLEIVTAPIRLILHGLAETEKVKIYNQNPLRSANIYSDYGLPFNVNLFRQGNSFLSEGDILQQILSFNVTPFGVKIPTGSELFSPKFSKQYRVLRDVRIQKTNTDWAKVTVIDEYYDGNLVEYGRLRPKLFGLLRYTVFRWDREEFGKHAIVREYEVDLSMKEGRDALKGILISGNLPFIGDLPFENKFIKQEMPIFISGRHLEKDFHLKPIFLFTYRDNTFARTETVDDASGSYAHAVVQHSERSKTNYDLGPFKKNTKERKCELLFSSESHQNENGLGLSCISSKRFASGDDLQDVIDSLDMMFDNSLSTSYLDYLKKFTGTDHSGLRLVTKLSLDHKKLREILETYSQDQVFYELIEMFFGKEYRKQWEKRPLSQQLARLRFKRKDFEIYPSHYEKYIPSNCDSLSGQVIELYKGVYPVHHGNCYSLVMNMFYRISKAFSRDLDNQEIIKQLDKVIEFFPSLQVTQAISNLIIRLAGGIENIHYSVSVDSNTFIDEVNISNYHFDGPQIIRNRPKVSSVNQLDDTDKRISFIRVKKRPGDDKKLYVDLYTKYSLADGFYLNLKFKKRRSFVRDKLLEEFMVPVNYNDEKIVNLYSEDINKREERFLYQNIEINLEGKLKNKDYSFMFHLADKDGKWLSEEVRLRN